MKRRDPVILVTDDAAMLSRDERRMHPLERDMMRRADRVVSTAEAMRMAAEEMDAGGHPTGESPLVEPVPLSMEDIHMLSAAALTRSEECEELAKRLITPPFASIIRKLRVDEGLSWRMVASQMFTFFYADMTPEDRAVWHPSSNQLMGMSLCSIAASRRGERYDRPPWN